MGDHGRAAMDFGDHTEVDRKSEIDLLTLLKAQGSSANKDAIGAEIDSATQPTLAGRHHDVHRGARPVASVKSSFHELTNETPGCRPAPKSTMGGAEINYA